MNPNKALWEKGDFTRIAESMRESGEALVNGTRNHEGSQSAGSRMRRWNDSFAGGEDSFVLDTRTGERKCLRPYRALASLRGQPYSFSRTQLLGKQADLGSSRFSALYMQQPQALEDQMFPEKVWGSIDAVNIDDLGLVVSAHGIAQTRRARKTISPQM